MTRDEIVLILRANVDKTVKITCSNGEIDLALIQSVHDEGVVYDLASLRPEGRKTAYWTPSPKSLKFRLSTCQKIQSNPLPNFQTS